MFQKKSDRMPFHVTELENLVASVREHNAATALCKSVHILDRVLNGPPVPIQRGGLMAANPAEDGQYLATADEKHKVDSLAKELESAMYTKDESGKLTAKRFDEDEDDYQDEDDTEKYGEPASKTKVATAGKTADKAAAGKHPPTMKGADKVTADKAAAAADKAAVAAEKTAAAAKKPPTPGEQAVAELEAEKKAAGTNEVTYSEDGKTNAAKWDKALAAGGADAGGGSVVSQSADPQAPRAGAMVGAIPWSFIAQLVVQVINAIAEWRKVKPAA